MTIITGEILVESISARESQLAQVKEQQVKEIFNKIKSLYFALWKGKEITTTEEIAEFFEVSTLTIRQVRNRHKDEFSSDGVLAG